MYRIGIDVGSTYTKYCVMEESKIVSLFSEKTPIRQREYFEEKVKELCVLYPRANITSCGYGKANVVGMQSINELTALAKGAYYSTGKDGCVLDIGGQDTKLIRQEKGQLREFFVNDKCAAGSGLFLSSALDMIGLDFMKIDLTSMVELSITLNSTCAVFAQSEIVEMIAGNKAEEEIIGAVLTQIFTKTKALFAKTHETETILSGGLSQIKGIEVFATKLIKQDIHTVRNSPYLAAIGSASFD